jgi:hypothetical protein
MHKKGGSCYLLLTVISVIYYLIISDNLNCGTTGNPWAGAMLLSEEVGRVRNFAFDSPDRELCFLLLKGTDSPVGVCGKIGP